MKNRLVMAPMLAGYANNGEVSERMLDYYLARAQGGVGAIIIEAACVDPAGLETYSQLRLDHPRYISGLEHLADTIKINGVVPILQIFHAGSQTSSSITGQELQAPSAIACPIMREKPRELTLAEIKRLEDQFVQAAAFASRAGFEGVELHAAHGYLINEFLSPATNKRTDEYGETLENRERFLLNIVRRIRSQLPDLIISVRLNMDDFVDNGLELEESLI
ncbi:MAG: NADH:flavin oxidoreductase, partial [Chitinophagales bacterium]